MVSWRPPGNSYNAAASDASKPVVLVEIVDVEPLDRHLSHGVFNDSPEFGSAHDRVVNLLRGFAQGTPIPPIDLVALEPGGVHKYRLRHGAHRLYCALAAGFSHIPAIVYRSEEIAY